MAAKKAALESPSSKETAFTTEERSAMQARAQELKAVRKGPPANKEDGVADVLASIAKMGEKDRTLAERLHSLITSSAPDLSPKTWYGMPAYARHGDVICFFQASGKFKTRYSTRGFSDKARLDEGTMWPAAYAISELTAEGESRIIELLKKALR